MSKLELKNSSGNFKNLRLVREEQNFFPKTKKGQAISLTSFHIHK